MYAEAISRDLNLMYSISYKQSDDESMKYREYITADLNQSQPLISGGGGGGGVGLARYCSAPNSSFTSLLESGFEDLPGGGDTVPYDLQFPPPVKQEMAAEEQSRGRYSVYEEDIEGVYRDTSGVGNNQVQVQVGGLSRQSSSPAGFVSELGVGNGFSVMSDVGNFKSANGINGKSSPSTRLNDCMNFASGRSSSSRYMPQIAENGNEITNPANGNLGNGNNSNNYYVPSFQNDSWNEPGLSGLKRSRESEDKFSGFDVMDSQSGDGRNYPNRLTHHMSLPKTSGEMAAVEKYLQFQQEAVPCKIRAKRGCATHPRSIAERMRRTRISDRMKKLQDLFPNMDKQTNTADMLDMAVEYIKDLRNQVQTLMDKKAKCSCSE